jgi:tetratricopeptide (TPR) repeat protein
MCVRSYIRIVARCVAIAGLCLTTVAANAVQSSQPFESESSAIDDLLKRVQALCEAGRLQDAEALCTSLLGRNINEDLRIAVLRKRVAIYRNMDNLNLALDDINALETLRPNDRTILFLRAETLQDADRYAEAMSIQDRVILSAKYDWEGYFRRGLTRQAFGYFAKAVEDFGQAIRLRPPEERYLQAAFYQRGLAEFWLGHYSAAESDIVKALKNGPPYPDYYALLGQAQFYSRKPEDALKSFERCAALRSTEVAPRFAFVGSCYADVCDFGTAIKFFDQAVVVDPTNADFIAGRGFYKTNIGDIDGAQSDLQRALTLKSMGPTEYNLRAKLEFIEGQYDKCVADYQALTKLMPKAYGGYLGQGNGYLLMGDRVKAKKVLEEGLEYATYKPYLVLTYVLAGGKLNDSLRSAILQHSPQEWPYSLVRYYLGELKESEVLEQNEQTVTSVDAKRKSEAYFYLGAFAAISGNTNSIEYFTKATNTNSYYWNTVILARKQLQRGFLVEHNSNQ